MGEIRGGQVNIVDVRNKLALFKLGISRICGLAKYFGRSHP